MYLNMFSHFCVYGLFSLLLLLERETIRRDHADHVEVCMFSCHIIEIEVFDTRCSFCLSLNRSQYRNSKFVSQGAIRTDSIAAFGVIGLGVLPEFRFCHLTRRAEIGTAMEQWIVSTFQMSSTVPLPVGSIRRPYCVNLAYAIISY